MNKVHVIKTREVYGDDCREGVHLFKPSQDQIEQAIEDAVNKGFSIVWVHSNNRSTPESLIKLFESQLDAIESGLVPVKAD